MKHFAMAESEPADQFLTGASNPIYTKVSPDRDFAAVGDWLWLKRATGNGFDVKAFNENYVFMRSTELGWADKTTFKRFRHDLPIAAR